MPRSPIYVTAALLAIADASAYILGQAENRQDQLRDVPPSLRMDLARAFSERFRRQLAHQRGYCRQGGAG